MPRFDPHPDRRPAVVTGASSGIGAATAVALAAAGHPVVLAARRAERLDELAAAVRADGGEAIALPLDLADAASIDAFAEAAADALGPVDVVVSNAGEVVPMTAVGADPDDFARSVHVNLLGAQRLVARLGRDLVARGHGDLVFVTSDVVVRPRTHMAAYVAAKAGLEGLCRAMQMELEGTGVRAGMVRPGPSSTEQGTTWSEETILHVMPYWERWGHLRHNGALLPRNVADAIVAMVSAPKGTHLSLVEVQPEAPVLPDRTASQETR
ncbi:MAG TPA: SDR family oxidoreductase [Aquihabitans sp.]|jgi:NADP-dependent 3-hydroxy acid dehydrogenase YdfG|nr:SDR family oxidoreductase [Aquihabitans sp.]